MISSMDDGSEQSAAALAGMATASDSELQKMVDKFTALQGEQKNTADSVGKLKAGLHPTIQIIKAFRVVQKRLSLLSLRDWVQSV